MLAKRSIDVLPCCAPNNRAGTSSNPELGIRTSMFFYATYLTSTPCIVVVPSLLLCLAAP